DGRAGGAVDALPGCGAPSVHHGIVERWMRGDHDGARALHARLLPLLVTEFQGLPHYVRCAKELLVEMGLISSSATRIGAPPLSPASRGLLLGTARRTGLLGLE